MRKKKTIIIIALLIVILIMAVGYATLISQLSLNGNAQITSEWNVKITEISAQDVSPNCNAGQPQFTNNTVTFNAELTKPGDYITYMIKIQNTGTIDAVLKNIEFTDDGTGSSAIIYSNSEPKPTLSAGEETAFLVKVSFDENATEIPEVKTKKITGTIEYVQS